MTVSSGTWAAKACLSNLGVAIRKPLGVNIGCINIRTCSRIHRQLSLKPFLYLDKNYVRMLGGIRQTLEAVAVLNGYLKVIQIKGSYQDIALEAEQAALNGVDVIFIDTSRPEDVAGVTGRLNRLGLRNAVQIAFGGNIHIEDVAALKSLDLDILDVGRQIVDAPLLDMRLEVIETA